MKNKKGGTEMKASRADISKELQKEMDVHSTASGDVCHAVCRDCSLSCLFISCSTLRYSDCFPGLRCILPGQQPY